jgi:hypothetical protein
MKTERIAIEIMGPDKAANGGIKISRKGKKLKWYYHDRQSQKGLVKLRKEIIRIIKNVSGVS